MSQRQLEGYRANTQASLNRLKNQSTLTLTAGALAVVAIQLGIDWYKNDPDYRTMTWVVVTGSVASLVAAGLWWKTGSRLTMLLASVIFQLTAVLYAFSVFGAAGLFSRGLMVVAFGPLGISLLAWHQYRSYVQVLNT